MLSLAKTLDNYEINNNFSSIIDQNQYTDGEKKIGYWENRWATGQSQWHKKDVNPFLSKYFEDLRVNNTLYQKAYRVLLKMKYYY